MRILITGAAGFLGASLTCKLLELNHTVFIIDNLSEYYAPDLKIARLNNLIGTFNINLKLIDITNNFEVDRLIKKKEPDVVINLAAQAGVRLPVSETNKYVESNLVGFSNILRSVIENRVPFFLYASSSSVYGNEAALPYTESEQNLHPASFYGATKLANELLTPTLIQNSQTVARGLRFFTVYGPWGRPDMAYFRMIANIVSGSEFNLFGDGSVERDFTYIEDAVSSVVALVDELKTRKPGYSDVVNLGGGRPLSMNYLLQTVGEISKKEVMFNRQNSNVNDAVKTMSDSTYIQSLIGSKPSTKLEDGIEKTIRWAMREDIAPNLNNWVNSVK
jgi:UDP-glucuronate 4-epimerase